MLKKQHLKSRPVCKVTFTLPGTIEADTASVVGDFNSWNPNAHQMKRLKNGQHKVTIDLEQGRQHEFRYLVNGEIWINDSRADRYVINPFGGENSVVVT